MKEPDPEATITTSRANWQTLLAILDRRILGAGDSVGVKGSLIEIRDKIRKMLAANPGQEIACKPQPASVWRFLAEVAFCAGEFLTMDWLTCLPRNIKGPPVHDPELAKARADLEQREREDGPIETWPRAIPVASDGPVADPQRSLF